MLRRSITCRCRSIHEDGRTEKLSHADFEEYLRRISTGRTIMEVGSDPDMMRRETFDSDCRRNPSFAVKVETVLDALPPTVQVRGQRVGKSLTGLITMMRGDFSMSLSEIADILELNAGTVGGIYRRGKKGLTAEIESQPEV